MANYSRSKGSEKNGNKKKNSFKKILLSEWTKGLLVVFFSVLIITGAVRAGSLTPLSSPQATGYTLSDIYTRLTTNATSTEANHIFSPAGAPGATLRTLKEIYDVIPTIDPTKVLADNVYLGIAGTIADIGQQIITPSTSQQLVIQGYHDGTGYVVGDADLVSANIADGVDIFGVVGSMAAGYLFGDNDASKVLTTAVGQGTYNATQLSTATVKKGTGFGVADTGEYSGYQGSGANRADLTQATCEAAEDWYWFEDGNGDGDTDDPEDGLCVLAKAQTTVGSWNGYDSATNLDNTYIADYTCDGVSFPNGSVDTYTGIDIDGNPDITWNVGDCALCQADCYDGIKDLPDNGGYKVALGDGGIATDYNGPITPKVLADWKGTRLPTSVDFFGFCGRKDGVPNPYNSPYDYEETTSADSANIVYGNYGVQVGRTDEFLDLANTNYEWLSELHSYNGARIAGGNACSYSKVNGVYGGYRFRAVFRP